MGEVFLQVKKYTEVNAEMSWLERLRNLGKKQPTELSDLVGDSKLIPIVVKVEGKYCVRDHPVVVRKIYEDRSFPNRRYRGQVNMGISADLQEMADKYPSANAAMIVDVSLSDRGEEIVVYKPMIISL